MTTTAALLPNGKQQFIDSNGTPLVGGFVYFYIPSTTTPKNTWQDSAEAILNTNPIVLDSRGQAVIFGSGTYRQIVKDADGNLIWDQETGAETGSADQFNQPVVVMASANAVDIGNADSVLIQITGVVSIASFGTVADSFRCVEFANSLTLINSSALALPGGNNITTSAGDAFIFISDDNGNWRGYAYAPANGSVLGTPKATVASATTCNIGAVSPPVVDISGVVTITSFGVHINALKFITFTGILTLTYNGTTLILPSGANITTTAGDTCIAASDNSGNWRVYAYTRADGSPLIPSSAQVLIVADQKASGTPGGGPLTGAWRLHTLNTVLYNSISGASLAANQVTLPAGKYLVQGWATGYGIGNFQTKIWNATLTANTTVIGANAQSSSGTGAEGSSSLMGEMVLATVTLLELHQQASTSNATDGYGQACSFGVVEVYASVSFTKIL